MTNTTLSLIEKLKKQSMQVSQAEREKHTAAIREAERQYLKVLEPFTKEYNIMIDSSAEELNTNKKVIITDHFVGSILYYMSVHTHFTLHDFEKYLYKWIGKTDDYEKYMIAKEVFDAHILLKMGLIGVSKDGRFWLTERGQTFLDFYMIIND